MSIDRFLWKSFLFLWFAPLGLIAQSPILESIRQAKERDHPPAVSVVAEPRERFQVEGSFLFWETKEDGLAFAALNEAGAKAVNARISSVNASWTPAFKLLLGAYLFDPLWEINVRWTWLYSRSKANLSRDLASGGIFPLWALPQSNLDAPPLYSSSAATLLMHCNALDLEIGSMETMSPFFSLKLQGGLKGISIDQGFHIRYQGGSPLMIDAEIDSKNECLGIGPRFGCGAAWRLFTGCSLIAELSGALALCSTHIRREDNANESIEQALVSCKERFWVWRPLLETKTGIRQECRYGKAEKGHLRFEVLYEMQQYWEQNLFFRYADEALSYLPLPQRGNLVFQGFSFTLGVGF